MSGTVLMLVGFVVLGALLSRWGWQEWQSYKVRRAMARMAADLREFQRALGEALMPAMQRAADAFKGFAAAWQAMPEEVRDEVRRLSEERAR